MVSREQTIAAAATFLLLAGCTGPFNSHVQQAATPSPSYSALPDDHTMGTPNAPITMIQYDAPTCPHCAHFRETIFPLMKANYIDTGKVFFVYRMYPLQPADAVVAAIAHCVAADEYFSFIDIVLRNQSQWDPEFGVVDVHAGLLPLARSVGISEEKMDLCINDKQEEVRIKDVAKDTEQKYNIQGVPMFVINGTVALGEHGWPDMRARLETLLRKH